MDDKIDVDGKGDGDDVHSVDFFCPQQQRSDKEVQSAQESLTVSSRGNCFPRYRSLDKKNVSCFYQQQTAALRSWVPLHTKKLLTRTRSRHLRLQELVVARRSRKPRQTISRGSRGIWAMVGGRHNRAGFRTITTTTTAKMHTGSCLLKISQVGVKQTRKATRFL